MDISLESAMLRRDISFALYGKVKEQAVQQTSQMLTDFAQAQPSLAAPHPTLGALLDVRV